MAMTWQRLTWVLRRFRAAGLASLSPSPVNVITRFCKRQLSDPSRSTPVSETQVMDWPLFKGRDVMA